MFPRLPARPRLADEAPVWEPEAVTALLLAHQGGWDEMLFVAVPILIFGGLLAVANRRASRIEAAAATDRRRAPRRRPAVTAVPRLIVSESVDQATLDQIRSPRHDVVAERAAGEDRYVLDHGPFDRYSRSVRVTPDNGRYSVTQQFDYRLPAGTWRFLMNHPMRRALRQPPRPDGRLPWWYPPQRPDARGAAVLGMLATLSLVVGYHGTLLTQTMSFAADEFGAGTTAQGGAFAAVRAGALLAILLAAMADRRGRRRLLVVSLLGCHRVDGARGRGAEPAGPGGHPGREPGLGVGRQRAPGGHRRRGDAGRSPGVRPQPAVDDRRTGRGDGAVGAAGGRRRPAGLADPVRHPAGLRPAGAAVRPAHPREPALRAPAPHRGSWPVTTTGWRSWRARRSCCSCSPPRNRSSAPSSFGTSGGCRRRRCRCSSSPHPRRRASASWSEGAWPTPGDGGWWAQWARSSVPSS